MKPAHPLKGRTLSAEHRQKIAASMRRAHRRTPRRTAPAALRPTWDEPEEISYDFGEADIERLLRGRIGEEY
jgi:hypothetical protein